jgi:hypothetical protein
VPDIPVKDQSSRIEIDIRLFTFSAAPLNTCFKVSESKPGEKQKPEKTESGK